MGRTVRSRWTQPRPRSRKWGEAEGWRSVDRGSATVWAVFCAMSLCVVFAGVLALGQVVSARHRAAGAADLAALAAAEKAFYGARVACAAAGRVAAEQGAYVSRCAVREGVADLTAQVRWGPYAPRIRSRAGPAAAAP